MRATTGAQAGGSGDAPPADPGAGAAMRMAELAQALLAQRKDEPERVMAELAALRATIERLSRAPSAPLDMIRHGLAGAGLQDLAPDGAQAPAILAALSRLHGLVTALAVTSLGKRTSQAAPAGE